MTLDRFQIMKVLKIRFKRLDSSHESKGYNNGNRKDREYRKYYDVTVIHLLNISQEFARGMERWVHSLDCKGINSLHVNRYWVGEIGEREIQHESHSLGWVHT